MSIFTGLCVHVSSSCSKEKTRQITVFDPVRIEQSIQRFLTQLFFLIHPLDQRGHTCPRLDNILKSLYCYKRHEVMIYKFTHRVRHRPQATHIQRNPFHHNPFSRHEKDFDAELNHPCSETNNEHWFLSFTAYSVWSEKNCKHFVDRSFFLLWEAMTLTVFICEFSFWNWRNYLWVRLFIDWIIFVYAYIYICKSISLYILHNFKKNLNIFLSYLPPFLIRYLASCFSKLAQALVNIGLVSRCCTL